VVQKVSNCTAQTINRIKTTNKAIFLSSICLNVKETASYLIDDVISQVVLEAANAIWIK